MFFKTILAVVITLFLLKPFQAQAKMVRLETDHIIAIYDQDAESYVLASVKVLELVRELAIEAGFDLPEKIKFMVIASDRNVLWFDRKKLDKITWEYTSLDNMLPPLESKKKNIYGLCHELGHLCMYRTFQKNNPYFNYNYRESWADYFGNVMIDSVFARFGNEIWPENHNYTEHAGMNFLHRRIENGNPDLKDFNACSRFWIELSEWIGFENYHSFFTDITRQIGGVEDAKEGYLEVLKRYTDDEDVENWYHQYTGYFFD